MQALAARQLPPARERWTGAPGGGGGAEGVTQRTPAGHPEDTGRRIPEVGVRGGWVGGKEGGWALGRMH